jgi:ectoine hydroxylase-related dioxygenase (phytanoyl-CoA dioxygenase family)
MAPKKATVDKKVAGHRRIVISKEEYNTKTTNPDNVEAGVDEFQTHGFVILENAIDKSVVDKIGTQMRADAATMLKNPNLVFNHGNEKNNFSVTPPLSNVFLLEDMWANRHATAIMEQIIGPRPILCWASSNVAIKSSADARQAVHSDAYADLRNFPFCIEMNIYLQDTAAENGSTELWPGTHVFTENEHLPHGRGFIKKTSFNKRARTCPPIQPTISAGSILMRDLRLWHAGMPNTTDVPRIIVAFLYFPQWFRPLMRLTLSESVRPTVTAWTHIDLLTNTDFVKGPFDHLRACFPMNFTQDPAKAMVQYRRAKDAAQGRTPGAIIPVTKDSYWTPSKYLTRKRKRETDGNSDKGCDVGRGVGKDDGKDDGKGGGENEKESRDGGKPEAAQQPAGKQANGKQPKAEQQEAKQPEAKQPKTKQLAETGEHESEVGANSDSDNELYVAIKPGLMSCRSTRLRGCSNQRRCRGHC